MRGVKISVVLPTLPEREAVFTRVVAAFEDTRPAGWEFDLIIPDGYPTVGEAWNSGAEDVDADYVLFTVDDAEPHPGWAEVAVATVEYGSIPAPRLVYPDGSLEACGSMGGGMKLPEARDWTECRSTGLIFTRTEWFHRVGEFLPIHYACDDDWAWRAHLAGYKFFYRSEMVFTHHDDPTATERVRHQAHEHIQRYLDNVVAP